MKAYTPKTITKICQHCNKEFEASLKEHKRGNAKYCSKNCSHASRRGVTLTVPNRECDFCNKPIHRTKFGLTLSKSGFYFCSRACKDKAQSHENSSNFLAMLPSHYKMLGTAYRKMAFRNKIPACEKCGYDKFVEILQVHHKDRNRQNNTLENLEILCPTCHEEEHFLHSDGRYTYKSGGEGENRTRRQKSCKDFPCTQHHPH